MPSLAFDHWPYPARLVRHAGQTTLRLPPGRELLTTVLARLRRIPIHA